MPVAQSNSPTLAASSSSLIKYYSDIRRQSELLSCHLSDGDMTVQSMPDASPIKWHLAHVTWFFETVILKDKLPNYRLFDDNYAFLFNSYYENLGARNNRSCRGMITRPSADEVYDYRKHVDKAMIELLETKGDAGCFLETGCNHEQQHQELLLMDTLNLFSKNPLNPAFQDPQPLIAFSTNAPQLKWTEFEGGIHEVGASEHDPAFAYDCEKPRHQVLLSPFRLANRLVTNGEWLEFMTDGGYENPSLWLSDGIATVREQGWSAPYYWVKNSSQWEHMTLSGLQSIDTEAPVSHLSYFEADAFAKWSGKRLPLEHEWEVAAQNLPLEGNFMESGRLRAGRAIESAKNSSSLMQMYGDLWEWTGSPYSRYPGFKPADDILREYNGKFMCGQFVLKGGSCATPISHIRANYRNFYYPHQRWMFSGLRLAEDLK